MLARLLEWPLARSLYCGALSLFWLLIFWLLLVAQFALASPEFAGSESCAACHSEEYQRWQQSHHRHALAAADKRSVQGDFSSQRLPYGDDAEVRFSRSGESGESGEAERYFIELFSPADQSGVALLRARYTVAYTLGHYPLQQYLVETAPGDLQVFSMAWDTRPASEGGQRWFFPQPEARDPQSSFYWKNYFHNANGQCLNCHVTDLEKGYVPDDGRTLGGNVAVPRYRSQWSESGVACESCHGAAGQHIAWAAGKDKNLAHKGFESLLSPPSQWQWQQGEAISARTSPAQPMDACLACHSLRQPIYTEGVSPEGAAQWMDHFYPTPVQQPLYFSDGQIREEVFVFGSFSQSKMHRAGVSCGNCHDPHSGRVIDYDSENLAATSNDAVCSQCHRADIYAVESHHHHPPQDVSARCVSCHMPERHYMQIDGRRDHSFKRPDPALSEYSGADNSCIACHSENSNQWAAEHIFTWRTDSDAVTDEDFNHWLGRQQAAITAPLPQRQRQLVEAEQLRQSLLRSPATPEMQRVMLLHSMPLDSVQAYRALATALGDEAVVVRLAAVEMADGLDIRWRQQYLSPLLRDAVKSVRLAATLALADCLHRADFADKEQLQRGIDEYLASYRSHQDLLASQMKLAQLHRRLQDWPAAVAAYRAALVLLPESVVALVNLADIYRLQQRDDLAAPLLQRAVAIGDRLLAGGEGGALAAQQADVLYALGLLQSRGKNYAAAAQSLRRVVALLPQNGHYFYTYLLVLDAQAERSRALALLRESPLLASDRRLQKLLRHWQ